MAKKANVHAAVLMTTFLLGLSVGFSACYAWFWFRAGGSPEETLFGSLPGQARGPVINSSQPVQDRDVSDSSSDTPAETARKDTALSPTPDQVGDVWPGRHLFLTVNGTLLTAQEQALFEELKPGGVLLRDPNCRDEAQVQSLVAAIKEAAGLGTGFANLPLVAVGQEGGDRNILKLANAPSAADLGAARDQAAARKAGRTTAEACRSRGIGIVFGPVLDVYEPGAGMDMATRSFSRSYLEVAAMGLAFADGIVAGGILPVAKHYPGIGSLKENLTETLPVLEKDLEGMVIMYPFMAAAERGIPGIMVSHVAVPAVEDSGAPARPASLSPVLVRQSIRVKWGYDGVLVADNLSVAAVTGSRSLEQSAVDALAAGCDAVVLAEFDAERIRTVCTAIEEAVSGGTVEREQLAESKRRLDAWRRRLEEPGGLKGALPRMPPKRAVALPPAPPPPDTKPVKYTIKAGDNLTRIAARYKVSVKDLVAWNGLKDQNDIKWGRKLTIHLSQDQGAPVAGSNPE